MSNPTYRIIGYRDGLFTIEERFDLTDPQCPLVLTDKSSSMKWLARHLLMSRHQAVACGLMKETASTRG